MKITLLLAALPLALVSCKSTSSSDVKWVDYGEDPMQNPQFMSDMMAAGTPGPQHAKLASQAGEWTVDGKMWMTPDADSMPMVATARSESWLDGRYLVEEFKSDFMGMPFEGRLILGYDNFAGEHWSIWMDSMNTGPSISRGTEVSPGLIEYHGTMKDLLTPDGRPTRMTVTENGDGTYTMRMFDSREGTEEFQVMELTYSRG